MNNGTNAPTIAPFAGQNVTFELVDPNRLVYDRRVQRVEGVNQARVAKMAADFKPDALGTITVSERPDGTYAILDGAHRVSAARRAGYTAPLHALVYRGLTLAQEADNFVTKNTFQAPSYISRFRALVMSGDEQACEIDRIAGMNGWSITTGTAPGTLNAANAAVRAYETATGSRPRGRHADVLNSTLQTITAAWGHDIDGVHLIIIGGVSQVFGRFETASAQNLATAMKRKTPTWYIANARTVAGSLNGSTASACGRLLVQEHNKGRRANLLPDWVWTR